jgi:hypothetical protein
MRETGERIVMRTILEKAGYAPKIGANQERRRRASRPAPKECCGETVL